MTKGRQKTYSAFLQKNFNPESLSLNFLFRPDAPPVTLEKNKEVICNDQPKDDDSESFKSNIPVNISPVKKEKIKYFEIVRVVRQKKRGKRRLKNNSKLHDKNSQYNIICKIKVYFTKSILDHANNLYKKSLEKAEAIEAQCFKSINQKEEKSENSINIDWFGKTVKEYLSSNISGKYYAHSKDYNKKIIEKIYGQNKMKNLIAFLEQNIGIVYKEYISEEVSQKDIFKGMRKINADLERIKIKYNYDNHYINEVKRTAVNLEQIFSEKKEKYKKK